MNVVERIDKILSDKTMSRRELAKKAGIPASTLQSAMQRGKNISYEMLQKIADALDVDINYLMHGKTLQQHEQAMIEELRLAAEANKTGDDRKLKAFIAQNLPHMTVKAGWESVSTDQNRTRMNTAFDQLNPEGQAVAADQVENLTYNPKYQKKESE